jgi:phenylacetate-coenzyme A ligase PaaK-like adenylate-forming protein
VVAADDPTHMSCALPKTFHDPASALWHRFAVTLPYDAIVAGLNRVRPAVLIGYPSLLHQLALSALAGDLRIAPAVIVSTSEPLTPGARTQVGKAWPAPLLNYWASTEAAVLGVSCGRGRGLHLSDDLLILEPIDAEGRPVQPGTPSARVLVTNLYNPTPLPMIRYEIGDEVMLIDEPCACGSAHRRVDDIGGRQADTFVYPGPVRVHPVVFVTRLDRERHIIEYRVRQTPKGAVIELRCTAEIDLGRLGAELMQDLERLGVAAAQLELVRVDRIERQASGKLKRFIALP